MKQSASRSPLTLGEQAMDLGFRHRQRHLRSPSQPDRCRAAVANRLAEGQQLDRPDRPPERTASVRIVDRIPGEDVERLGSLPRCQLAPWRSQSTASPRKPGSYAVSLNGEGQAVFSVTPAQPKTAHRLTVYQHFVATPVAIGAATNPTAMLNPLVVKVN